MSILHHLESGSHRLDGQRAWSSSRIVRLSALYRRPTTPPAFRLPEPLVGLAVEPDRPGLDLQDQDAERRVDDEVGLALLEIVLATPVVALGA
jgi:hypothetical protein